MKLVIARKDRISISRLQWPVNCDESLPDVPADTPRSIFIPVSDPDYQVKLQSCSLLGAIYLDQVPLGFLCSKFPKSVHQMTDYGMGPYFEIELTGMADHLRLTLRDPKNQSPPGTIVPAELIYQVLVSQ